MIRDTYALRLNRSLAARASSSLVSFASRYTVTCVLRTARHPIPACAANIVMMPGGAVNS